MESPPSPPGSFVVEESEVGLRLDAFLVRRHVVPSAAAARRALASGVVRVGGRPAKKGAHLRVGDTVDLGEVALATPETILAPTPELALDVLFEDDVLIAVDKPAQVPSHPLRPGEGPSVASALVARFPECASASLDAREGGLCHRLDVGTSGVILAARNREAWYRLREAMASPYCTKTYLAEVVGRFPQACAVEGILPGASPRSFVVSVPIGRTGRHGDKVKLGRGRQPLPARTEVAWLEDRANGALVEAKLSRGRAHQVRAHLAYLGTPVAGDSVYGEAEAGSRLHLHAQVVDLIHPLSGKPMRIESPPPSWARRRSSTAR